MNRTFSILVAAIVLVIRASAIEGGFDLVILNGRVMDPESGLDGVRSVGIKDGRVTQLSSPPIKGTRVIDAKGLVVAPGFIDLHQHAQDEESYRLKALDGVTTALELELGAADIDAWYSERAGKLPINYGVSIGHVKVRMAVMGHKPSFVPGADSDAAKKPAGPKELAALRNGIEKGLRQGALAVGFGIAYTPNASRVEIMEMFRVAAKYGASCHVHMRKSGHDEPGSIGSLQELMASALITGAPLHIVHIQSTGKRRTPELLRMVEGAQRSGLDLTAEVYPYTAGMTDIRAAIFDPGWRERFGLGYHDMQWAATGERMTADSFAKFRKIGGMIILHTNPELLVRNAVIHPATLVASDGLKGHPRNSGTFSRVLGYYVREQGAMSLMEGLRKITLLPARRLEKRNPVFRRKGRVRHGSDADLTIFDPRKIIDQATYLDPLIPSTGIKYVIVGGKVVVDEGKLTAVKTAGQAVRGPIKD
jgi:N-acyl-D-aspartate/D-glutamate deacylase